MYRPIMQTLFKSWIAALAVVLLPVAVQAQEVVFSPGSTVGLVPPAGMKVATSFSGFEDPATKASILLVDIPGPSYADILKGFTPDGMAATGFQVSGPAIDWPVKGGEGRLLKGKQTVRGFTFRKWVLLARSPATAAMLNVQLSDLMSSNVPDATIEQALKTVVLRKPPPIGEQVAALPFRVGDLAGFRIVRTISGSGLVLTDGPQDVVVGAAQPTIAIGAGNVGPVEPNAQLALAKQGFTSIAGVSDLLPDAEASYAQSGSNWVRLEGRGTYRDTLEAIYVLQIMRFTPAGYLRAVVICRTLDKPYYEARFKALAESIAPK